MGSKGFSEEKESQQALRHCLPVPKGCRSPGPNDCISAGVCISILYNYAEFDFFKNKDNSIILITVTPSI